MTMPISSERIDQIKDVLYNHYLSKNSNVIGDLSTLRNLLDTVLNDTSYNKFRIVEACHFLDGRGYIGYVNSSPNPRLLGVVVYVIKDKLIDEMKQKAIDDAKEENEKLKVWY